MVVDYVVNESVQEQNHYVQHWSFSTHFTTAPTGVNDSKWSQIIFHNS